MFDVSDNSFGFACPNCFVEWSDSAPDISEDLNWGLISINKKNNNRFWAYCFICDKRFVLSSRKCSDCQQEYLDVTGFSKGSPRKQEYLELFGFSKESLVFCMKCKEFCEN